MRVYLLLTLVVAVSVAAPAPALDKSKLQFGNDEPDQQPFVEEVVVESVLQVRSPAAGRQARTDTKTSLQDGARVSFLKSIN